MKIIPKMHLAGLDVQLMLNSVVRMQTVPSYEHRSIKVIFLHASLLYFPG